MKDLAVFSSTYWAIAALFFLRALALSDSHAFVWAAYMAIAGVAVPALGVIAIALTASKRK